ncbi:acyl-CoA thioesterase [Azotobacter chroococcum subsp. isscasi]|uniref:acyl-CoA thioesterase n=1 Tax=Azotobacter chroococcum TaxID=353 RepID=UPI00103F0ED4|nr:acyl-CoA thioesterase [Azotobacter chroococcum]TBW08162.1 acyl-CoA thioesterase [Azotobacter chroococcum subsp. isscasi]
MTPGEQEIQRRIASSEIGISKAVFPFITNHRTLFGDTAPGWMDEISFIPATRFCRLSIVTVSLDRVDFKHPIPGGSITGAFGFVAIDEDRQLRAILPDFPMEKDEAA